MKALNYCHWIQGTSLHTHSRIRKASPVGKADRSMNVTTRGTRNLLAWSSPVISLSTR